MQLRGLSTTLEKRYAQELFVIERLACRGSCHARSPRERQPLAFVRLCQRSLGRRKSLKGDGDEVEVARAKKRSNLPNRKFLLEIARRAPKRFVKRALEYVRLQRLSRHAPGFLARGYFPALTTRRLQAAVTPSAAASSLMVATSALLTCSPPKPKMPPSLAAPATRPATASSQRL